VARGRSRRAGAEIGGDDGRIGRDLARAAARDLLTLVEHHHPARQRHDDFHDVLDNDERDAGAMDVAHQVDREFYFLLGEARHGFVEQQHLGFSGERAGDFQPLAAGRAKRTRRRIRQPAHADALQHGAGFRFGLRPMRGAQERADHDVLQHRHAFKRLRHLEGARQSELRPRLRRHAGDVMAFEQHLARGRNQIASQAIEEGRLAGAVRSDQAENIARLQRDAGGIDGLEAAKGLGDVAGFKEHWRLLSLPQQACACPIAG
jgi:hypothetical protein